MSSPQHPTGSGPQPWQDQPPQYPGQNQQQPGGAPGTYGSGPGPYGSAPGPYGSGPAQYGSAPGPYGPGSAQYGSAPGPYGSGPAQYGSGPGPYGSAPGQFGGAPAPKQKTGPGLIGPLTLRDLFLLFAGLLALIALFVPYRAYSWESSTLWHWNVADMGALVFAVLTILLIVTAVLVNKLGSGRMRIGSLSLDQFISVLSAIAFTYVFVDLLTSAVYWHVGSYLTFFAALIAFFAGVFTTIPFFAKEFDGREAIETHPKARPVSKHTPHPAPVANVPGGNAGGPGFAPYGSAPVGGAHGAQYGQGHPGQPGQGQPGQSGSAQFAAPGQPVHQDPAGAQGQTGSDQFAQNQNQSQNQFGAPGQGQQPGQFGQPDQSGGQSYGQADRSASQDDAQRPNPYAPPQQQETVSSANTFAAPTEKSDDSDVDSADGSVHSTGDGQTYLGRRDSEAPQHSQSEPTQAFGVGAGHDQTDAHTDQSASDDGHTPADRSQGDADQQISDSSDPDSGAAAAAASVGVVGAGAGAVAAGTAAANSDTERRRGRHAAPESDSDETAESSARPSDDTTDATTGSDSLTTASAKDAQSHADEVTPTVVSPAESSDLVSKVNSKSSDTNTRASDGVALGGDSEKQSESEKQADSAERQGVDSAAGESSAADGGSSPEDSVDSANIRSTEATVVSSPADENVVAGEPGDQPSPQGERAEAPESEEPTQYVPVANYRSRPETENRAPAGSDSSDEDTVAQTAIDSEPVPADAGQARADDDQNGQAGQNTQDGGRTIIQAFWFAVPEPREAVDPTTGMPVFTIYPGDWYLSLEDNGSWFKVRDTDGREGVLRNIDGIQRG